MIKATIPLSEPSIPSVYSVCTVKDDSMSKGMVRINSFCISTDTDSFRTVVSAKLIVVWHIDLPLEVSYYFPIKTTFLITKQ